MTHQVPVLIRAPILDGAHEALDAELDLIRCDVASNPLLPFERLSGTHFARFVVLPGTDALDVPVPASLIFASSVDVSVEQHIRDVVTVAGDGLDRIFGCCEDYPPEGERDARTRIAYLRRHTIPTQAYYVNTIGRTVDQIHSEAFLRARIEDFLDAQERRPEWRTLTAVDVRSAIRSFVSDDPELRWALGPPPRPPLWWRLRERLRFIGLIAAAVLLAPLLVPLAAVMLILYRVAEWRESRRAQVSHRLDSRTRLALDEDLAAQNQFSAAGLVKPGLLHRLMVPLTLWIAGNVVRHVYNRGDLGTVRPLGLHGVNTIHFARWVLLDGGRRAVFMSNYDGSFERYMDDFINKVAWGLNGVFTHGVGYPPTRFLVLDGARDEQAFKAYLRERQLPTAVWYSAYPALTAENIANNAAIRAGLSRDLRGDDLTRWLRRF